jgi:hypothetical protein
METKMYKIIVWLTLIPVLFFSSPLFETQACDPVRVLDTTASFFEVVVPTFSAGPEEEKKSQFTHE